MRQMPSIKTVKALDICEASPNTRQNPSDAKLEYAGRTNTNSRTLANSLRSCQSILGNAIHTLTVQDAGPASVLLTGIQTLTE